MSTFPSLFVVLIMGLSFFAHSASNCVGGNCEDGIGRSLSKTGFMYFGEWKNGKWNGYGIIADSNGKCEGQFVNSSAQGVSHCSYTNGKTFYGNYSRGRRSGEGIFFNLSGSVDREGIFDRRGKHERSLIDLVKLRDSLRQMRDFAPEEVKEDLPNELTDFGQLDLLISNRKPESVPSSADVTEVTDLLNSLQEDLAWAIDSCVDTGFYLYSDGDDEKRKNTFDCILEYKQIFPFSSSTQVEISKTESVDIAPPAKNFVGSTQSKDSITPSSCPIFRDYFGEDVLSDVLSTRDAYAEKCLTCRGDSCYLDQKKMNTPELYSSCKTLFCTPTKLRKTEFSENSWGTFGATVSFAINKEGRGELENIEFTSGKLPKRHQREVRKVMGKRLKYTRWEPIVIDGNTKNLSHLTFQYKFRGGLTIY